MGGKNEQDSKTDPTKKSGIIALCVMFGLVWLVVVIVSIYYYKPTSSQPASPPPLKLDT